MRYCGLILQSSATVLIGPKGGEEEAESLFDLVKESMLYRSFLSAEVGSPVGSKLRGRITRPSKSDVESASNNSDSFEELCGAPIAQ